MSNLKFGNVGIVFGAIALLLSLTHFWAGPFSPKPTLENYVAEKAVSIRNAIENIKNNEQPKNTISSNWDTDKVVNVITVLLGGLAIVLAGLSFIKSESEASSSRIAIVAAGLGVSAIAFQFIAMYAMALLVILLIGFVISNLGFG